MRNKENMFLEKEETIAIFDKGLLKEKYKLEFYSNGMIYKQELYPKLKRDRKEVRNDGLF